MRKNRLRKLAKFLREKVPLKKFDMGEWADLDFKPNKCGTAACAAGWATTIFRKQGLRLNNGSLGNPRPEYKGDFGIDSLVKFFDLKETQARYLFFNSYYSKFSATPKIVARRIEDLIKAEK